MLTENDLLNVQGVKRLSGLVFWGAFICVFSGCVSAQTRHDEFVKGRINGMQISLNILRESTDKKDAMDDLKELLGCEGEWK